MRYLFIAGLLSLFIFMIFPPTFVGGETHFKQRAYQLPRSYSKEDIEAEVQFGRNLAAKILGKYKVYKNEETKRYISLLGNGLVAQIGRSELNYYFAVLDTNDINAYACPGGYIFITRGAIAAMKNEAQLAGVIAHEIGHVNKRHVVKKLKIRGKENSVSSGIASAIGGTSATARILFEQLTEEAFKLLFEEGVSKESEFESDAESVEILTTLGYDWKSYRDYLLNIDQRINSGQGNIISKTHPSIAGRIKHIEKITLEQNLTDFQGKQNTERFLKHSKANDKKLLS
ncbi:M48 family metalloprotease [bacterium]|nr:M48 family metalloprotease [bacterium]